MRKEFTHSCTIEKILSRQRWWSAGKVLGLMQAHYLKRLGLFSVFCWYSFPRRPLIGQKSNAPSFSQTLMKTQSPHSEEQMISIKLQSTLRDFDILLKWIGGREMTAIKRISHHRALKSCCQKSADKNIMPIMGGKKKKWLLGLNPVSTKNYVLLEWRQKSHRYCKT